MGEVSDQLGLSFAQLRLWEKEFDVFHLKKNKKGDRYFTKKDIENLKLIKHLLKEKKYTIKGAKEKLRNGQDTANAQFEAIQTLQNIRAFLVSLKENI